MTRRRFTIADLMILVPASAISAMLLRWYMVGFSEQQRALSSIAPDPLGLARLLAWVHGPGSCLVVPGMAAMIVMRLRRPRPRLVRFQPGFVACVAVFAAMIPGVGWFLMIRHRPGFARPSGVEQAWSISTLWAESAVVGAWITLWLMRRWRPEPSWVDRTGRALGWYWVIVFASTVALRWLTAIEKFLQLGWGP